MRITSWFTPALAASAVALGTSCFVTACSGGGNTSAGTTTSSTSGTSTGSGGGGAGGAGTGGDILLFSDSDGDGLSDVDEGKDAPGGPLDTDGDGVPDYLDTDSDADGLPDADEGLGDLDGDGVPDARDPINDIVPDPITLTPISTPFNSPIGIDFHQPTASVVISANYPTGLPSVLERIESDGAHQAFSALSGLTDEVKIATVRPGNPGGFSAGELFVGNGIDGEIVRVGADGSSVVNPWVSLPGDPNGLFRGGFYVDPTGIYGGDLIAATTTGEVWRITSAGVPAQIAALGVHLEGVVVVPNFPARYGPLAGKILCGAEDQGLLHVFDANGPVTSYALGVNVEDIDLVMPHENFFGVNFGTSLLLGAVASDFQKMVGDVLLTQETHTATGLYRLYWDGATVGAQELPLTVTSAIPGQWEHVTFGAAGIVEIPPPL